MLLFCFWNRNLNINIKYSLEVVIDLLLQLNQLDQGIIFFFLKNIFEQLDEMNSKINEKITISLMCVCIYNENKCEDWLDHNKKISIKESNIINCTENQVDSISNAKTILNQIFENRLNCQDTQYNPKTVLFKIRVMKGENKYVFILFYLY